MEYLIYVYTIVIGFIASVVLVVCQAKKLRNKFSCKTTSKSISNSSHVKNNQSDCMFVKFSRYVSKEEHNAMSGQLLFCRDKRTAE